jgi:hypothetical protein
MKSEIAAAQALMGGAPASAAAPGVIGADLSSQVAAISLLSGDAFRDLGKAVAARVSEASGATKGGGALAMRFYNELLKVGLDKLSSHEIDGLSMVVKSAHSAKVREESAKNKGAKAKPKAAKVQLGGNLDAYGDDDDYAAEGPARAPAAAGETVGRGNAGNVDMSAALAGISAADGAAAATGTFTRTAFKQEEDFM